MNKSIDNKIVIAIDGYSSSGKSTMAKALASRIGYRYVDSGAMYRAVTLYGMNNGLIVNGQVDTEALIKALPAISIDFEVKDNGQHTILNGDDVENEIRTLAVSGNVSKVAVIPEVRHFLVKLQQDYGKQGGIVMDGRDIGTTVFPDARLKIFVNASPKTRAKRRYEELLQKGEQVSYQDVLDNVLERDHIDETRAESPLRRANDAIDFDNSSMTIEEQNDFLLNLYNQAVK